MLKLPCTPTTVSAKGLDMTESWRRRLLAAWFTLAGGYWITLAAIKGYNPLEHDFGVYWAGALVLRAHGAAAIYNAASLAAAWHSVHPIGQLDAPADYLPPFFLAFSPLTWLPPGVGFALWTLLNLLAAAVAVCRLARRAGDDARTWSVAMLLFSPFLFGLFIGQPTGLVLFSFYRAYVALEDGQDVRAGLWLGALLLKPQDAIVLALVLVCKRRWRPIAGLVIVGAAVMLSSLALFGLAGAKAYAGILISAGAFRTATPGIGPEIMISWRGLLTELLPGMGQTQGLVLTLVLSILSVVVLIPVWRGPWKARNHDFAGKMLATMIVTMLVGYHNHIHAASLLLVPGAALAAATPRGTALATLLRVAFFVPGVALLLLWYWRTRSRERRYASACWKSSYLPCSSTRI